jgi:hypothetical protein
LRQWAEFARTHAFVIGLLAIVVLATVVRLPRYAIDIGRTPLDIDENRLAANVQHYFLTGEVRHTHIEHYPGIVFWFFAASSLLTYLRALTSNAIVWVDQLPVEAFAQACRLANIWIAAATVAVTGMLGRQLSGTTAALIAAGLVAIAPMAVEPTVLVRNDAGMVLAAVAATYAGLKYHDTHRLAWIVAAGALAGLAAAIKYTAVFAIVPVVIAATAGVPRQLRLQSLAAGMAAFLVAVGISNHFMWSDFPGFLHQVSDQYRFTGRDRTLAVENPGAIYLTTLAWTAVGWLIVLLAAGSFAYALATWRSHLWIFLSFPLFYFWFMTQRPLQVARWVYPLLPFVAIGGAAALVGLMGWTDSLLDRRRSRVAVALLMSVALAQPVWVGAVSFSRRLMPSTHELTEGWIREHAAPETIVLLGNRWLDMRHMPLTARRVRDLNQTLDGGLVQLSGCNWVVVPEPFFGHQTLRHLRLLQGFYADRSFGGNLGLDYEIYEVPDVPSPPRCGNPVQ